jgi:replication factor A1
MMNDVELAPYIEDITWALENNIDSEEIASELKRLINDFTLPLDEAKRCVLKKFGADPKQLGNNTDKSISELKPNEYNLNLLCKIIYIDEKEVTVNGNPKRISFGILGDTTGTVPFTAWHDLEFDKGQVIRIYNAYTKSWQDKIQVHLGDRTHVRLVPEETLPMVGVNGKTVECKVNEFRLDHKSLSIILRILEIEPREIILNDKKTTIFKGTAADETGKCRFTAWSDLDLAKDDVIKVESGYLKPWRGVLELHLNGGTIVDKLDNNVLPPLNQLEKDVIIAIHDLRSRGGVPNIALEGIILDIKPNSGLIKRCPECRRVLQNDSCMVHGGVAGNFDLRVKAVLDDGTGAISIVLDRQLTEQVLGLDMDGCISKAKEHMRYDIIFEDTIKKLLAKPVRINGSVLSDEFGMMLIANKLEMILPKIRTEAVSLLEQLGIALENGVWENDNNQ